ncbi:MAG: hypothetical protein U0528_14275 [Anaerolineae bacterium]
MNGTQRRAALAMAERIEAGVEITSAQGESTVINYHCVVEIGLEIRAR